MDINDPHMLHGEIHATCAAILAIIDALPPAAKEVFYRALTARSQRIRDFFGDQALEDQYFEAFDAVIARFRE